MPAYLHDIQTVTPEQAYPQTFLAERMKTALGGERFTERLLDRVYRQSGIETRHSVLTDADDPENALLFQTDGSMASPGTRARNEVYTREAKELFYKAACRSLRASDLNPDAVTHVITVSCTGFFAPGPDLELVKRLNLKPSVMRFHVGFMGCYAAFPALKMAKAFVEADPEAVVLVASVELCTLHLKNRTDPDNLIAASVFADGGAAAMVSAKRPEQGYNLEHFYSSLVTEGETDMAWTVGDEGFDMVLSSYVPKLLEANIEDAAKPLFAAAGITKEDIGSWAIHPGGRAILDKVERGLALSKDALNVSRDVLRHYGNMSSATILFVLEKMLFAPTKTLTKTATETPRHVYAAAFGPGLTVESALLEQI